MPRLPLLLSVLLSTSVIQAQHAVRISDPSAIVLNPNLGNDPAAQAGMQAAGLGESVIAEAVRLSNPSNWPAGLKTDSARTANRAAIANYTAFLVCEYATSSGPLSIVSVPVVYNYQMPEDLRGANDFYLVVQAAGLQMLIASPVKEAPSTGPSWRRLRPARIMKPDAIYATFDLKDEPGALSALEKAGLSRSEIEAVVFRSHERNWPDGIDSFDERYPKLAGFKKYKAYRLARWDDKVLLVVPAEANRKRPEGMRPYLDIYMVFDASAVKVSEKK